MDVEVKPGNGGGSAHPIALDTSSSMLGIGSDSDCLSIAEEEDPPQRSNTMGKGVAEASAASRGEKLTAVPLYLKIM